MLMDTNGHTILSEDYCSYEVAKLLKEKGFPQEYDIYHSMVYNEEDYEDEYEVQRMVLETKLVKAGTLSSYPVGVPEPKCYCPTLQMAMKWLREVHNISVEPLVDFGSSDRYWWSADISYIKKDGLITTLSNYKSYEEAVESALKYSLENLI